MGGWGGGGEGLKGGGGGEEGEEEGAAVQGFAGKQPVSIPRVVCGSPGALGMSCCTLVAPVGFVLQNMQCFKLCSKTPGTSSIGVKLFAAWKRKASSHLLSAAAAATWPGYH